MRIWAVELDMAPRTVEVKAGAMIWATGWTPFDMSAISYYGAGKHRNVISNVVMERLASANGPTRGVISGLPTKTREEDSIRPVRRIERRKQPALLFRRLLPRLSQAGDISARTGSGGERFDLLHRHPCLGQDEAFFNKVRQDERVSLVKGKAGEITENPETGMVTVQAEDQATGKILRDEFDLVVLAAGMVPSTAKENPG